MTTSILKLRIKKKFGSMAKFAKLIGIDRYELQKFIASAEKKMTPEKELRLVEYAELVRKTRNDAVAGELTFEIRTRLKGCIEAKFGSVAGLCLAHPEFNQFSVWQVLNGRRKNVSAAIKNLMQIVEYDESKKQNDQIHT